MVELLVGVADLGEDVVGEAPDGDLDGVEGELELGRGAGPRGRLEGVSGELEVGGEGDELLVTAFATDGDGEGGAGEAAAEDAEEADEEQRGGDAIRPPAWARCRLVGA